ncbi:sulfite exporter TauE/SafE family protein [Neolewinella lacunae]|uniref:Probable membrane transporter protein n=1 Tax=Neolewinella lacunae TaxID=1517758 RepID=A0A923PLU2_9BACT|nr:sulfite exporter TauE/SafE family protein [Neolewinella lacunae]MBC6994805.1 sulfite exporter TauE/SafE family protein [Neolewinella lacunae]MDN3634427.1 sulfite exporter TauE/SafE family protein [Neolewinella lacunae]
MDYLIALVGAFLAGSINTLSGNGSAITLTILMELLGLPPDVANGTNRVGVLGNSLAGSAGFYRGGRFTLAPERRREMWEIVAYTTLGALLGIYLSLVISNEAYRAIFRYLLVLMLLVILIKPKRWLVTHEGGPPLSRWISIPVFFALGIYGGFIQMGMGVFFIAVMVLLANYEIIQANVVKAPLIVLYTFFAVVIYAWRGLIDWQIGSLMAVGQIVGGYLTARFAARHPRAGVYAYRLLIVVVIAAILKAFWPV